MRLRFRAHPRSRVGDTQNYVAALADNRMLVVVNAVQLRIGCLDNQLASIRHGVARVDHQIHDDLFHLAAVGTNGSQIRRRSNDQLDVLANQPREQPSHVADNIIQIHDLRLQHLETAEGEKLPRQSGSAIRGPFDLLDLSQIFFGGR